jgi:hypothetical protein
MTKTKTAGMACSRKTPRQPQYGKITRLSRPAAIKPMGQKPSRRAV